jgi:DsbC/DsbD-like thiol-disulfide interchange protein
MYVETGVSTYIIKKKVKPYAACSDVWVRRFFVLSKIDHFFKKNTPAMTPRFVQLALLGLLSFISLTASAQQNPDPIKWAFTTTDVGNGLTDLVMTGTIEEGWNTYSQKLESDWGPIPTSVTFAAGKHYQRVGEVLESGDRRTEQDPVFDMKLTKYKHKIVLTQRVRITDRSEPIVGFVTYMTCNDEVCLPPKDVEFKF